MRYFIYFGYNGAGYHGWQLQPNAHTVQAELQSALSLLAGQEISVVGAGRTDAGVHARNMVAHFDIDGELDAVQMCYKLNRLLPRDIVVYDIARVADDMHARFSAVRRTYRYYVHTRKDPFLQNSLEIHYPLDFDLMNKACEVLMGYSDFGAFCKKHSDVKTTICHITSAGWTRIDDHSFYFEISANRFLRNMVRAIVGTLLDVGRKKMTIDDMKSVIENGNRSDAGESMPAKALFLESVSY